MGSDPLCISVSGNAAISGGGLAARSGTVSITQSTLSGNSAQKGAAIFSEFSNAYLTHVTSVKNTANLDSNLFLQSENHLTLTNSILFNDLDAPDCVRSDLNTTFTLVGVNLVGNKSSCLVTGPEPLADDPLLEPLANNGGPILTHLPGGGSPVIDSGDKQAIPPLTYLDQRGSGYPRINGHGVDIGSVELSYTIFFDGFEQAVE